VLLQPKETVVRQSFYTNRYLIRRCLGLVSGLYTAKLVRSSVFTNGVAFGSTYHDPKSFELSAHCPHNGLNPVDASFPTRKSSLPTQVDG